MGWVYRRPTPCSGHAHHTGPSASKPQKGSARAYVPRTEGASRRSSVFVVSWHDWFNVSGGQAALASPIAAIARNPDHPDLFVTGPDGGIYSTWWDAASGWASWFNVSGGRAALGSPIPAV